MFKRIILVLAFTACPLFAQTAAIQNHCFLGGTAARTSGLNSSNYLNGIIPHCTITVYLTGTQTLATIYSNASGGVLSNPFTANAAASIDPGGWIFWAAINQGYDIVMSGGDPPNTYPQPMTLVDQFAGSQISGVGGTVQPTPQFRLFIQPNAGTQTIAGPSNIYTDATGNPLTVPGALTGQTTNGAVNTDMSGGISGVFASSLCTGFWGCDAVVPPTSTDTASAPSVPSNSVFNDLRYGQRRTVYSNPQALVNCNAEGFGGPHGHCEEMYYTNYDVGGQDVRYMKVASAGYNIGNPAGNSASGWTVAQEQYYGDDFWTRGIKQHQSGNMYCYGIGDCDYEANYLHFVGGQTDASGEGIQGHYVNVGEVSSYLHATIATGGTTGSNLVTTTFTSGDNHFIDGGFLLDTAKSQYNCNVTAVGTATIASTTSVTTATVSGCNVALPVSTVWGVSQAATVNYTASVTAFSITSNIITVTASNSFTAGELVQLSNVPAAYPFLANAKFIVLSTGLSSTQFEANFVYPNTSASMSATASVLTGQYQVPVQETIQFKIDPASPNASTGYAAGAACTDLGFAEQVQILSAGTVSGGLQTVTFLTRYGYPAGTVLMQGGMCGQYATNTANSSWRTADMAIGSTSATTVVMSHCIHGTCNTSNAWSFIIGGVGSNLTFYPGAEIIGTEGGLSNTAQLGYNTAPWANGDTVEDPHPSAVEMTGGTTFCGQTTIVDPSNGSVCTFEQWAGPATATAIHQIDIGGPATTELSFTRIGTYSGSPANLVTSSVAPTTAWFDFSKAPDVTATLFGFPASGDSLTHKAGGGLSYPYGLTIGGGVYQNGPSSPIVSELGYLEGGYGSGYTTSGLRLSGQYGGAYYTWEQMELCSQFTAAGENGQICLGNPNGSTVDGGDPLFAASGTLWAGTLHASTDAHLNHIEAGVGTPVYIPSAVYSGTTGSIGITYSYVGVTAGGQETPIGWSKGVNNTSTLGGSNTVTITCPTSLTQLGWPAGMTIRLIKNSNINLGICPLNGTVVDNGSVSTPYTGNASDYTGTIGAAQYLIANGGTIGALPSVGSTAADTFLTRGSASGQWKMGKTAGAGDGDLEVATVNGKGVCASDGTNCNNIANVQIVLPTAVLAANTCSSAITTTMTGVTATSTFTSSFATDASGVTGYGSSAGLNIVMWPTANTNNLKVCNSTGASITPGAMTLNVGAK